MTTVVCEPEMTDDVYEPKADRKIKIIFLRDDENLDREINSYNTEGYHLVSVQPSRKNEQVVVQGFLFFFEKV